MTNREFEIYSKSHSIKEFDREYANATQAWFNQAVKATKEKTVRGKKTAVPVYEKFDEFYNAREEFYNLFRERTKEQEKKPPKHKETMADRNRRLNQNRKGGN